MSFQVAGNQIGTDVFLNVYHLEPTQNSICSIFGLGFYHTGIHIGLIQYTFAGHNGTHTGVAEVTPKTDTPNFFQAIYLGKTMKNWREINNILNDLREAFPGNSYHICRKNCNSFSNALAKALLGHEIPGYINRVAKIGSFFLDIEDFVRMKPYSSKYENLVVKQDDSFKNIFESKSKGVIIG